MQQLETKQETPLGSLKSDAIIRGAIIAMGFMLIMYMAGFGFFALPVVIAGTILILSPDAKNETLCKVQVWLRKLCKGEE